MPDPFISSLLEKTTNGDIPWEETESAGVYQVAFPDYVVRIERHITDVPFEGSIDYVLAIYDDKGRMIDQVNPGDLLTDIINAEFQFRGLHQAAQRRALGVDKALDKILSSLTGKGK